MNQMEDSISNTLIRALNFKLSERYHNKYNKVICDLCDAIIDILKNSNDTRILSRLKILNCNALKVCLEFSESWFSNKYTTVQKNYSKEQLQALKEDLERCLNCFDVVIEPYDNYHRFDKLSKTNCEALKYILEGEKSEENIMTIYENVMKLNCSSLYEILEWRSTHKYKSWYDTLMKVNIKALKEIFEAIINLIETYSDEDQKELSNIHSVLNMKKINKRITEYLEQ